MSDFNTTAFPNQPPAGEDDSCTPANCPASRSPNLGLATIPLVLFSIITLGHVFRGIKHRTWGFVAGMVIGGILEFIGYVGRVEAHHNPFPPSTFIMEMSVLTFAPVFFCASIYLPLVRIIIVYGAHIARIRPTWYTKIFITCDVISLLAQVSGDIVASSASSPMCQKKGSAIIVGALVFQAITISIFGMPGLEFAWRIRQDPHRADISTDKLRGDRRWMSLLIALPMSIILILARCIYRTVDMAQGFDGALSKNQTTFIIFESVPIIFAAGLLLVFHPGFSHDFARLRTEDEQTSRGERSYV